MKHFWSSFLAESALCVLVFFEHNNAPEGYLMMKYPNIYYKGFLSFQLIF